MQNHPGLFIVLEGADGSGKTTQFRLLTERIKAIGHEVEIFDFPRYDEPSSYFVKKYLNGEYGEATLVSPYTASMFYALDRYEASSKINEALKTGKIVLANRYVGSNMAHQGSKFGSESEQRGFFVWAESLEFQLLGIPRPTINIYLKVPPRISYELIAKKADRDYTDKKRDGHENSLEHLHRSAATYDLLTKLFPKDFIEIECASNEQIMGIAQISDLIWAAVGPMLPPNPPNPAKSVTIKINHQKYLEPIPIEHEDTKKHFLVRNVRKISDPKIEIYDVSLLASLALIESGASNNFEDNKWHQAKTISGCNYFMPSELPSDLKTQYLSTIDAIARQYISMKQTVISIPASKMNKASRTQLLSALQNVIPLCGFFSLKMDTDQESLASAIKCLSTATPKLSEIDAILTRLAPMLSKDPINSGQKQAPDISPPLKLEEIIKQLAENRLPQTLSGDLYSPKLTSYAPHNEFDLLIDNLLPKNSLSREKLSQELDKWSYTQKSEALKEAITKHPKNVVSQIFYCWDSITDRTTINYLASKGLAGGIKSQILSLRYGFVVPEIIEKYGLSEQYLKCFELSETLYGQLQTANLEHLSGYAALMGHRSRWQFNTSAAQWIDYIKQSGHHNQFFETIVNLLKDNISEVHPILSSLLLSKEKVHSQKTSEPIKSKKHTNTQ